MKRSNIGEPFKVNATVTKSLIEDLEKLHGIDMVQRLESVLVAKLGSLIKRREKLTKILSKI
jgi:hypothetical protein